MMEGVGAGAWGGVTLIVGGNAVQRKEHKLAIHTWSSVLSQPLPDVQLGQIMSAFLTLSFPNLKS